LSSGLDDYNGNTKGGGSKVLNYKNSKKTNALAQNDCAKLFNECTQEPDNFQNHFYGILYHGPDKFLTYPMRIRYLKTGWEPETERDTADHMHTCKVDITDV
jgi:hypothetical protein